MTTARILPLLLALTLVPVPLASAECRADEAAAGADAASVEASRTACESGHEGGFGDWWFRSATRSDRTEASVTTTATGTETVFVDRWNESIEYGDASGSGAQYGDWIEAGHSSSLNGEWRYQTVKAGTAGWRWEGQDGWTDTDMIVVESQVYDSAAPTPPGEKPGAWWYESWLVLQRFDTTRSGGEEQNDCHLFAGSTALPGEVAYVLAAAYESVGGVPYAACDAALP